GSSGTPLQTSRPCGRWVIGGFSGATLSQLQTLSETQRQQQAQQQSQQQDQQQLSAPQHRMV
ncbi:hypothetical protein VDP97_21630, partial [Xanthomonas campestris pv. campestris]|nr:hypothetical protein [Xanthomonas campestris pv. campestris]MEB1216829.1 hypothetical protein [Xanthomonas campestris pv. campestris]